ncbi:MAG: hypothetical protein H6831_11840 [Planctomycetes bacterium]|nr:hypothetical protein [Planctomycetota bacterium]MCB9905092.1 hypothetical protein [Planctomycetota bacterium]
MRIELLSGLLGLALLAAPAVVSPVQEEEDFDEPIDDSAWTDFLPPTKEQAKRNAEMDKLLQGAWQLVSFEAEELEDYGRHDRAIALFGPGFFSIEMHIAYEPIDDLPGTVMFQSGTFRYRFDDEGQLLAKLSIGAAFDRILRAMFFERPGQVRTFGIEVTENTLELRREPGGFRYEFTRLRSTDRNPVDIYGRPIVDDDPTFDIDFDPPNFEDPVEGEDPEKGGDGDGDGGN